MDTLEQAKNLFFEGLRLLEQKNYAAATERFRDALRLAPERVSILNNLGGALIKLKQIDEAEGYLRRAIDIEPDTAEVWLNVGLMEAARDRYPEALECLEKATALNPDLGEAWVSKAGCLMKTDRFDEALDCCDKALHLNDRLPLAWFNKGDCFMESREIDAAVDCFEQAYALEPHMDLALGALLRAKTTVCDWTDLTGLLQQLGSALHEGQSVSRPFPVLGLLDRPDLQRRAAELYVDYRSHSHQDPEPTSREARNPRAKIGYFSADFHNHATSYLMARLLELHDRSRFELVAFSFGPDKDDQMRRRVAESFDVFLDVRTMRDDEIAAKSRELGIDLAIDLKGFTKDCRPGIFAAQAAPLQVNYLGYPGTMGARYIDYLIADPTLIPPGAEVHYSEKIVYLPHSYQVNDDTKLIAEQAGSRRDAGLPEEGFVFCCFNQSYKILPDIFDRWMRMLHAVDGSALWLMKKDQGVVPNLRREAEKRGIDPERLVFADRIPLTEHLARHRHADLFIDTLPYNAHTTASDALWAGLPVVTCTGESFASRVSASLLKALDLPELITTSLQEFEDLAISLARDPTRLGAVREKLSRNRLTHPLFDTQRFTRDLETAYERMLSRQRDGLPPDHIVIESD